MNRYNPKDIEQKWQKKWEEDGTYSPDLSDSKKPYFGFGMFNYPSGAGIHVGHVRNYTIPDVVTRAKRQQGYNTYQPVGWDSFGLPAENYAIKTGVSPQVSTKKAIEKYQRQYRAMGWGVDWQKEIDTTDPKYYKWTQWVFSKLFENDLAYQKESPQWWCDQCKTVLADEQVIAGKCWRHESADDPEVTKKSLNQWFFKITDYADELLDATDDLQWTQSVKASQKSWIGRSEGINIDYEIVGKDKKITCFTTTPVNYGMTFIVVAPEHDIVKEIVTEEQKSTVQDYIEACSIKSELERMQDGKVKTGVFTGSYALNQVTGKEVPIWVADFVLMGFGTGAVQGCPAHDERDFEFAKNFNIPITRVVEGPNGEKEPVVDPETEKVDQVKLNKGVSRKMVNSDQFNGLVFDEAMQKTMDYFVQQGWGTRIVNYKMRDWLISRQRYWGAPIPIIHCDECGPVLVPEKDLPVLLPELEDYKPTGGKASVLATVDEWVNVPCPTCDKPAKRETDTMDGYVCSSWYFFRYLNPHDDTQAWDPERAKQWMPVDFYNGGDHATAHLLYARFFTRFFHKLGLVGDPEPFKDMVYNGKIKASDGSAFSKTLGNGVDPLEVIESGYGADALRLYIMFAAPVEQDVLWDMQGVPGAYRFLNRTWNVAQEYMAAQESELSNEASQAILSVAHKTVKKVTHDIEGYKFNTAIAAMMEAVNSYFKLKEQYGMVQCEQWKFAVESLLQNLAPFAPHMTEELWGELGHSSTIHADNWPNWEEKYLTSDTMTIVVQINGKVRANIEVPADADKDTVIASAQSNEKIAALLQGKEPKKTIYISQKLVNFVV